MLRLLHTPMTLKELWHTPGIKTLLACALASALFTLGLFIYSLDRQDNRIVGTVILVNEGSIVIEDPRGQHLTLLITPDTKTRALGPLGDLAPGTLVMASGERIGTSTIEAFGIRRIEERNEERRP